jgi:hypothetical protein
MSFVLQEISVKIAKRDYDRLASCDLKTPFFDVVGAACDGRKSY